ncbi:MAG: hypothetical protein P8J36_05025 [Flavobacteriales bacterium]|nr:hypothetical protein [Flavobacteriales bacterium]
MKSIVSTIILVLITSIVFSQERIIISSVNISGNKITKKEIIIRELVFYINSITTKIELEYNITESQKNLTNLKLFNFNEIRYTIIDSLVEIDIEVVERWYFWPYPIFEVSERNFNSWWNEFKASKFSDFSRLNYGLFLNWNNFRGRNELIQLKIRRGFKEHYLISYQLPFINRSKTLGLNTDLQMFRRKKTFYKTENDSLFYFTNNANFTSKDYELSAEIVFRKNTNQTHRLKIQHLITEIDSTITIMNPNYLNNNNVSGDYTKFSYLFTNETRDYIEYPLSGYLFEIEAIKNLKGTSPVNHLEIVGKVEKHIELKNRFFLGSSFKSKWSSDGYQPYFAQEGFGFDDYVRGYEYYVIDGQDFWLSKTVLKYALIQKTNFKIPYVKMKQFNKSHYSLYLGLFSDMGYVVDNQNSTQNNLSNQLLWGNGISIDYVTYYDKLLRIEFSINHLGEKGVFLHFSNPFGSKDKL